MNPLKTVSDEIQGFIRGELKEAEIKLKVAVLREIARVLNTQATTLEEGESHA